MLGCPVDDAGRYVVGSSCHLSFADIRDSIRNSIRSHTLSAVLLKLPDRKWTEADLEHYTPCGVIEF
jgi:hypothetical protein